MGATVCAPGPPGRLAWAGPGRERDLVVQSLKAAGAALLAWLVGSVWLGDPLALMASWVALILVQATVYSSLRQAAQQLAAIRAGIVLASAAPAVTGSTPGHAGPVGPRAVMLPANWPRFGDQGVFGAASAVHARRGGRKGVRRRAPGRTGRARRGDRGRRQRARAAADPSAGRTGEPRGTGWPARWGTSCTPWPRTCGTPNGTRRARPAGRVPRHVWSTDSRRCAPHGAGAGRACG
jgi:hypothetical protein